MSEREREGEREERMRERKRVEMMNQSIDREIRANILSGASDWVEEGSKGETFLSLSGALHNHYSLMYGYSRSSFFPFAKNAHNNALRNPHALVHKVCEMIHREERQERERERGERERGEREREKEESERDRRDRREWQRVERWKGEIRNDEVENSLSHFFFCIFP